VEQESDQEYGEGIALLHHRKNPFARSIALFNRLLVRNETAREICDKNPKDVTGQINEPAANGRLIGLEFLSFCQDRRQRMII
jgi:hypothetical protein